MIAQPGPYKLAIDLMNKPGAVYQDHILIVKRENSTSVRGKNAEVTVSHLPYHFTYVGFFPSSQDYWNDHTLYIMKMEKY